MVHRLLFFKFSLSPPPSPVNFLTFKIWKSGYPLFSRAFGSGCRRGRWDMHSFTASPGGSLHGWYSKEPPAAVVLSYPPFDAHTHTQTLLRADDCANTTCPHPGEIVGPDGLVGSCVEEEWGTISASPTGTTRTKTF